MKFLTQYNKAFVALIMMLIYFVNAKYGIDIPLDESTVIIIYSAIISILTYFIPNTKVE